MEVYCKTIDDMKTVTEVPTTNSLHDYYMLKKYGMLKFDDVEKPIMKRRTPEGRLPTISSQKTHRTSSAKLTLQLVMEVMTGC